MTREPLRIPLKPLPGGRHEEGMHPLRLTTLVFPLLAALVSRAVDLPAGGQDLSGATPVKGHAQP